jgi:hypothetical protein
MTKRFKRWTKDNILRDYRFCNVFRVTDRISQFVVREVIEAGSQKPADVVFRVALFNLFTKIETYQLLDRKLGPLTWVTYCREKYESVLAWAKDNGKVLYTGAYQKAAYQLSHSKEAFRNHLRLLEAMMNAGLVRHIMQAKSLAEVYTFILEFPGMGSFTSYQLLMNLSYTGLLNFSEMDFVVGGPGSRSGLSKCFGSSLVLPKMEADVMRWMAETQDEHFARLGLKFNGLGPQQLRMGLADIEHTLCEVDRYSRVAHPKISSFRGGTHKRTTLQGKFQPSSRPYPKLHIPKAWAHPDRKIVRPTQVPQERVEKRYVIENILGKQGEGENVKYLVEWWGYPLDDATWEPKEHLMDQAPDVVEEYEKRAAKRVATQKTGTQKTGAQTRETEAWEMGSFEIGTKEMGTLRMGAKGMGDKIRDKEMGTNETESQRKEACSR